MLDKVWGKPNVEMQELTELEDDHACVLEQKAEIEALRQNAKNSQKAIQLLETRLQEETAKRSSFDDLSAKVKVLEAENESLKAFIQESSDKENEARKELSEKHARELAELNEKLEKSQTASLGFEWTKESNLKRTEAYDEARISIDALFAACRGIAKTLSLKKAKTTVIDTMTKLMEQVPEFIKDWQESSARGVASLVLATCKAHFPHSASRMLHAEHQKRRKKAIRSTTRKAPGQASSVPEKADDDSEAGSGDSDGDGSAYQESEEEDSE
ncbi:hypothetical protein QYE76_007266 [Lolium multiflorum]|uniref:Uncharacterized protein n=1 Tax=Lolium multiflorum TaxID=4521 RepID=A0AAD8RZS4_LOLMU|nr:hypothetical protein QYE76_007266 [Lolium multiflorum]